MAASKPQDFRAVYRALHRQLTVCGVDDGRSSLALVVGAATFNLFYDFLAGCLLFGELHACVLRGTRHDPHMLEILLRADINRDRYDAPRLDGVNRPTW